MKLLTKAIEKKLERRGVKMEYDLEDPVICKFFNPMGRGTWYVMHGYQLDNGDWLLYGLVNLIGDNHSFGSFLLSELAEVTLPWGLKIERDRHFDATYEDMANLAGIHEVFLHDKSGRFEYWEECNG